MYFKARDIFLPSQEDGDRCRRPSPALFNHQSHHREAHNLNYLSSVVPFILQLCSDALSSPWTRRGEQWSEIPAKWKNPSLPYEQMIYQPSSFILHRLFRCNLNNLNNLGWGDIWWWGLVFPWASRWWELCWDDLLAEDRWCFREIQ